MNSDEYNQFIKKHTPSKINIKNMVYAFLIGGFLGLFSQIASDVLRVYFNLKLDDTIIIILLFYIFIACVLTAFHVFDDLVTKFGMGLIIPITGFAHSICSAFLDYKKDGLITGLGANVFKLAGSVLLYGIVSAFLLSIVWVVIYG